MRLPYSDRDAHRARYGFIRMTEKCALLVPLCHQAVILGHSGDNPIASRSCRAHRSDVRFCLLPARRDVEREPRERGVSGELQRPARLWSSAFFPKKNRDKTPENWGYGKPGCGSVHHWHWLRVA